MTRIITAAAVLFALTASASPAEARIRSVSRPTYSKPVEHSSSSPRGCYSSSSNSSSEDGDSAWTSIYYILVVLIVVGFVIRIIAGIVGFLVWLCRPSADGRDDRDEREPEGFERWMEDSRKGRSVD